MNPSTLREMVILLGAGLAFVLLFRRLGLGAVLGYLVAGASIGLHGLGLVAGAPSRKMALPSSALPCCSFSSGSNSILRVCGDCVLKSSASGWSRSSPAVLVLAAIIAFGSRVSHGYAAIALGMPLALSSTAQVLPMLQSAGRLADYRSESARSRSCCSRISPSCR